MSHFRSSPDIASIPSFHLSLLCVLLLLSPTGEAATLYVEKWGDFSNQFSGCAQNAPCESIQHALDAASPNDRVVVGPGTYLENVVINTLGIKVSTSAGRHATTIDGSETGNHAAQILQPRVQFGKKGKGFTLIGASGSSQAGLYVDVTGSNPKLRIEGNRFGKNPPQSASVVYSNYFGMDVSQGGEKIQIRHNIFQNNQRHGLVCSDCSQAIVRENRIERNGEWGIIHSGNQAIIERNLVAANLSHGFQAGLSATNSTIRKNVSEDNVVGNFRFVRGNGLDILRNIAVGSVAGAGMVLNHTTAQGFPARFDRNLLAENATHGLLIGSSEGVDLERNLSMANGANGFHVENTAQIGKNRFNAAIDSTSCGFFEDGLMPAEEIFRFFALNNGMDFCSPGSFIPTGAPVSRPAALGVSEAARVVGG